MLCVAAVELQLRNERDASLDRALQDNSAQVSLRFSYEGGVDIPLASPSTSNLTISPSSPGFGAFSPGSPTSPLSPTSAAIAHVEPPTPTPLAATETKTTSAQTAALPQSALEIKSTAATAVVDDVSLTQRCATPFVRCLHCSRPRASRSSWQWSAAICRIRACLLNRSQSSRCSCANLARPSCATLDKPSDQRSCSFQCDVRSCCSVGRVQRTTQSSVHQEVFAAVR